MRNKAITLRSMTGVLILGAAAAIVGACQSSQYNGQAVQLLPAAAGASSPVPPALSCTSPSLIDEGGPQSRMYKGGCLQQFSYFYLPEGELRVSALPPLAKGVHTMFANVAPPYDVNLARSGEIKIRSKVEPIPLYEATVVTPQGKVNLCDKQGSETASGPPDKQAEKAIALPGLWEPGGREQIYEKDGKKVFSLSCASGVIAKCVKWGYGPSETDVAQRDLYSTCLHAARGEFNRGDNVSYTCKGTQIYLFSQQEEIDVPPGFIFEANWGKDGVLCMDRPRFTGCERMFPSKRLCEARERDGFPPGVLLKTYSRVDNRARSGRCPQYQADCELTPSH